MRIRNFELQTLIYEEANLRKIVRLVSLIFSA